MKHGTCKHFNGMMNKSCKAGIVYLTVAHGKTHEDRMPGCKFRYPCITDGTVEQSTCPSFEAPTAAEIAEHEAEVEAAIERMKLAGPMISEVKREHKGKDWRGVKTCPACGGKLFMTHSGYNGHVWGNCETDGCLGWME